MFVYICYVSMIKINKNSNNKILDVGHSFITSKLLVIICSQGSVNCSVHQNLFETY